MLKLQITLSFILLLVLLQSQSIALDVVLTEGHHEIGVGKEYFQIDNLWTYNDVTVTTYQGGGAHQLWMYDNSELVNLYDGVDYLYLYENTMASFFRGFPAEIYIDPASTAQVLLYAYDVTFIPVNPPFEPYGEGRFHGRWIADDISFDIPIFGSGAYSHVQIVPEPASAIMLSLGSLFMGLRKRRRQVGRK
jgi:hypothetical protein